MKIIVLCIILTTIGLYSCTTRSSKSDEDKKEITKWYGKEIRLPKELELELKSNLKAIEYLELFNAKYKILVYVDSNGCVPCRLALFEWRELIKETEHLNKNVSFLFYISLKDYDVFEQEVLKNQFDYPVIYDKDDKINKLNHFPKNQQFHIFLLNDKNKVLLVGNPIGNPKLKELYLQQISK